MQGCLLFCFLNEVIGLYFSLIATDHYHDQNFKFEEVEIGCIGIKSLLSLCTNFLSAYSVTLTPDSPRWVGAWWIGFLISATLAFLVALPIAGFPKSLPGSEQYKAEREKEVYSKKGRKPEYQEVTSETETAISYKQILKSIKILVTNPTFMFLNLAAACEGKEERNPCKTVLFFSGFKDLYPISTESYNLDLEILFAEEQDFFCLYVPT